MEYSCNDSLDGSIYYTSDAQTIAEYMSSCPDTFSSYIEILKKTGYYSTMESYGSYTVFAPNNEAVAAYIKQKFGVDSVSEITDTADINSLKYLVRYQTMPSKKYTSSFNEGRMTDTTYTGDYLTVTFTSGGGLSNVLINKTAKLKKYDIECDNGIIDVIDSVLDPKVDPVPIIMEESGDYTIFVEALKQTGYYSTFSKIYSSGLTRTYYTIFAESDSVYALSGINSFQDLVDLISPDDSDYTDELNNLNRFVAYHAVNAFEYTIDMPDDGFLTTVLSNNAIVVKKTDIYLKLNEQTTDSTDNWISLITSQSNNAARNGCYHTLDTIMNIYVPEATYILFDVVTDQPEYQSGAVSNYTKYYPSAYSNVDWYPTSKVIRYIRRSSNCNHDNTFLDAGGFVYLSFVTPVLPKGKYTVTCLANGGNSARGKFQVYWDGNPIGTTWNVTQKYSKIDGWPDDSVAMEAAGWRHGLKSITNKAGTCQYDVNVRRVITTSLLCPTQSTHIIKFKTVKSGGCPFDFIEFIPTD